MNEVETTAIVETPDAVAPEATTAPETDTAATAPEAANDNGAPPVEDEGAARRARVEAATKKARERIRSQERGRAETAQLRAELERERSERTRLAQLARSYEEADPLTFLEQKGIPAEQIAQRIVQRGTPEEKIAQLERRLNETSKQYEDRLHALQAEQERREYQERETAAQAAFLGASRDNAERHEMLLARFGDEQAIIEEAIRVAKKANQQSQGKYRYATDELLEYLHRDTEALFERVTTRATSGSKSHKPGSSRANNGQPTSKAAGSRTLSNSTASEVHSLPANIRDLPEAEQMKHYAEMYERLARSRA